ncbi:MAG TPA: hypothetical protein PKE12_05405 [Kiritimatiellia bacterium]|nr:hypothetical protein [Kiritimatiellia bacterium]
MPRISSRIGRLILALCAPVATAQAAEPFIETFSAGMNGWTNTAGQAWQVNSGSARTVFPGNFVPGDTTLAATGALQTAAFTGNYAAAGITLVGFKFQGVNDLPAGLTFRLFSGTNSFTRSLSAFVAATGVWYQFFFSLENKAAGVWVGGDESAFAAAMQDITRVDFAIANMNSPVGVASTFRIDDIVVDRLPAATSIAASGGTNLLITGDFLQSNVTYLVEATPELTGVWTAVQSVLATNRSQLITLTNDGNQLFWRIALP